VEEGDRILEIGKRRAQIWTRLFVYAWSFDNTLASTHHMISLLWGQVVLKFGSHYYSLEELGFNESVRRVSYEIYK